MPVAAAGLAEIGAGHALPAMGGRVGEHRLQPRPRSRVARLALARGDLGGAHPGVERVPRPLEPGEIEQPRGARAARRRGQRLAGRAEAALEGRELPSQGAPRGALVGFDGQGKRRLRRRQSSCEGRGHRQPPIGARGLAPQKTWVKIIPIRCTSTRLTTIDLAVAVPTPTGPPEAL